MGKTLVALMLILAAPVLALGQALQIDAARDRALTTSVRAFLNDTITVGQPFAITRIVVVARDAAGALLRGVPIAEVELVDPPLLNHRSDATPENHLHPVRPGRFHVRARTICGDQFVAVLIPATIH